LLLQCQLKGSTALWQALNPIAGKKSLLTSESQWSSDELSGSYSGPDGFEEIAK
jgi:hypothetical protein